MPFDSLPDPDTHVAPADEPMTYKRLVVVLRDKSLWPKGFRWHYGNCDTCAIGLALRLAGLDLELESAQGDFNKIIRETVLVDGYTMPVTVFNEIFWRLNPRGPLPSIWITPQHVAQAIEDWFTRGVRP